MNHSYSNSSALANDSYSRENASKFEASLDAETMAIYCCLGLLSLLIVLTNLFVIFLILRHEFLKTVTNLCLACLAASDILSGLVVIPLLFLCNLLRIHQISGARQACITMDLASRFIAISTISHLLTVTGERYLMIVHPMKYSRIVTKGRVKKLLFGLWVFSFSAVMIQLAWIKVDSPVSEIQANTLRKMEIIYDLCVIFGIVVFPLVIMAVAYAHVFLILRRQLKNIERLNNHLIKPKKRQKYTERKAVAIFSTMIVAFALCWFAYFLASLKQDLNFETAEVPQWVDIVLLFMRFGTGLLNPVLYTFFKEDFKRAIFKRRRDEWSYHTEATGT